MKNRIIEKRKEIIEKQNKLQKKYQKNMNKLDEELFQLQEICKHDSKMTIYHPDPSGNNDSEYECPICGKWAKDLSKPRNKYN